MSPVPPETVAGLAGRLRIAASRIARDGSARGTVDGMTPSRIAALTVLRAHGPLRMGALAERLGVSAPTASRIVECLCAWDMVERVPDPADHRATRVRLSPEGTAALAILRERGTGLLADRIADLTPAEVAALDAAMAVLERIAGGP